jgi:hypothetical protein
MIGEGGSLVADSKGNHVGMLVASAIKQDFSQTFVAVSCLSDVASHIKSYILLCTKFTTRNSLRAKNCANSC